jgi:hypothetical protein
VDIRSRGDVPAEIEARVRAAVQRDGREWDEISVFCLIEHAPGEPHTWLFGFSAEPLAPGDQVKSEAVSARLTTTLYASGQAPAPHGPPISVYDRIVRVPPAAGPGR